MLTDPVTVKRTVMPGVGLPAASSTVAVTQCWVETSLVSAVGLLGGGEFRLLPAKTTGCLGKTCMRSRVRARIRSDSNSATIASTLKTNR